MLISKELFNGLLVRTAENPYLHVKQDLLNRENDTSQCMLNALQPVSFVDIYRHSNTSETVVILRGAVTEIFYDNKGVKCARYELPQMTDNIALQIPEGQWHTLIPHEPSVIMEAKDGRYEPLLGTDIWTRE